LNYSACNIKGQITNQKENMLYWVIPLWTYFHSW